MLHQGLYEQVLYKALHDELESMADHIIETSTIDEAEASSIISKYLANVIRQALEIVHEKNSLQDVITLTTTMYDDYSINEELFHWQSQSTTSESSRTGQRYAQHGKGKYKVLLFVREFKKDIAGTAPYTFLGLAEYIKHEGSRPMSITYKLQKPIPARFLKKTNKLLVG